MSTKESEMIIGNIADFLKFLKTRITMIHMSNVFFRDLHYGTMAYLEKSGKKLSYAKAEPIAREVAESLEKSGVFRQIDRQSWLLNYPEFALPRIEKKAS